ncbi:MAG: PD-(D/E)XK nuclease family protein [Verrucomicrobia bacterium]|nr:PD-(D/E)XK nuclease family protein [Verrucomicrobiota bacterium]
MPEIKIQFWGWDAPVLSKAVAELTGDWSGGELDLTQTAIVVPTMETSRRLREALALELATRDGAVVAPHVWHPENALDWNLPEQGIASALQERLAWSRVLMETNLGKLPALFPMPPEEVTMAWASSTADTLRDVRHTLGAGGFTMDAARRSLAEFDADSRWNDLVVLEAAYLKVLRAWKLDDRQELKRAAAQRSALPDGVNRVLVFAVPDAPPLFRVWLNNLSDAIDVQIFVQAPESDRTKFDALGAPLISAWGDDAGLVLPMPESQMHRAAGPEDQARRVTALLAELAARGCSVAVGACDMALNSVLEGSQVLRDGWRAKHQPAWRAWLPFLRQHDVLQALGTKTEVLPVVILEQLDDFHAKHLPATLNDALELSAADDDFNKLHSVFQEVIARSELWAQTSCAEAVRTFLEWIYGGCEFDSAKESDRHYGSLFSKAISLAAEVDASGGDAECLSVALDVLEETPLGDVHGEAELVLHGWLELLWEPAHGLVIAGANDEHLPGVITVDAFLPDRSREKLGLACQSRRRARDAYLLRAIWEQRRADASLHLIYGCVNAEGDALRPSRLLLDCADKSLPARVRHLFPDENTAAHAAPRPSRSLAFALKPELKKWKGGEVSPSQLKDYLACPFRFYLKKVLKLKAVDSGQRELSPGDLGNVMHDVLKSFAESPVADAHHAGEIADWLVAELEKQTTATYGRQPLFSVALQIESMRQRLRKFAEVQSEIRAEGWRIIAAEKLITADWGVKIGGVALTGKIDRIDRHEKSGVLRVIDYKTSQSERGPVGGHVKKAKPSDLEDETIQWQCFDDAQEKPQRWLDLQLPLYALAVAAKFPEAPSVDAAYLCLPATVDGIELKEWKRDAKSGATWNQELLEAAKWCAEEAVRRMSASLFWPPSNDVKYDDFEELLLGDAQAAVYQPDHWEVMA